MPDTDPRTRRRRLITLLVFLALILGLVWAFRAVLMPFLVALFFAYLIDPVVVWLRGRSLFGKPISRIWAIVIVFVAAVIGFQLVHHMVRQGREVRWLAGAARLGTSSLVATGAMLSAVAVLGAVIIGPAIFRLQEGGIAG